MTIQAVVFDWAGTTIDYGSRAPIIAFQRAFAHFGITVPEPVIRADVGLDKEQHIAKIFGEPMAWTVWQAAGYGHDRDAAVQAVYAQFKLEIQRVLTETATLKPGLTTLLDYLNLHHVAIASTSGYTADMIAQVAPVAAEQGYQPEINVTSELTGGVGRPQGDMLNYAMQVLHVTNPQNVIKVGDTVNDILEGANAGAISVGVLEGSNVVGLAEPEYVNLTPADRQQVLADARRVFMDAGADAVVDTLPDLIPLIERFNVAEQQTAPLLLTPGPLTTSRTVKETMLVDHGTWDDEYKAVTEDVRRDLLMVGQANPQDYTTVLMQGSGSFAVEATLQTAIPDDGTVLIAINGAYGQRMASMADRIGIRHLDVDFGELNQVTLQPVLTVLAEHPEVTHFAMVHSETTTGILNPLVPIIPELTARGIVTIVDAMSSFGGVPLEIDAVGMDYLISSANKCIQGVPGFAFVIAKRAVLAQTAGRARSLSLDLYDQWRCFENNAGKWRFTSPTHTVYAFHQALHELFVEGGVRARNNRYASNEVRLRKGMASLGFEPLIAEVAQSPIITSFKYPHADFDFTAFYHALKDEGFIIYPGKVSAAASFRIGNIGEVYDGDVDRLLDVVSRYVEQPAPVR